MQWKLIAVLFGYVAACTCDRREANYGESDRLWLTPESRDAREQPLRPPNGRVNLAFSSQYKYYERSAIPLSTRFGDAGGGTGGGSGGRDADQSIANTATTAQSAPCRLVLSGPPIPPHNPKGETFSTRLHGNLARAFPQTNIIFSPISLRTMLAYLYMAAKGRTADELFRGLDIPQDKREVAYIFRKLMLDQQRSDNAKLIMANKMYYNRNLKVCDTNALRVFQAEMEPIDFSSSNAAASQINGWVSRQTNNHINNLITPQALDESTQAIVVNAIYFKAKWLKDFSTSDTEPQNFYESRQKRTAVDMMFNEDTFNFQSFPDLQAQVLELPYLNSNLSMLIILPNDIEGLQEVEQRMTTVNLNWLAAQLKEEVVTVRLPKFKVEFDLDMVGPLKQLGIEQIFSKNAELTGFFRNNQVPVGISKVQHKAFINVNEAGTEAGAASYAKILPLANYAQLYFTVDHPFMFAIRGPDAVYFVGRIVKL